MDQELYNKINDKNILITGGTGSFGHEVVKRLLSHYRPKKIIVFSRDEKKQFDMSNVYNNKNIKFVIGDVRNRESVDHAMNGVNLVFHAAALKQVPNCEFFPMEAVRTNVIGSHNVINSAIDHNIEKIVVLSTDKAVQPINVMGKTKALMERIMIAASREKRSRTVLCGVRYGNVMYTRGSVIPFYVKQIKEGKPLNITNPDMTRFLIKLEDSINLVFYALANGEDGDIYVKKAPASTVGTLAGAMVGLFSHQPGVKTIGIRHGEKIHETLVSKEELLRTVDCGDYYMIKPETPGMDYRKYYSDGKIANNLPREGYNSANTNRLDAEKTKKLLLSLEGLQKELRSKKTADFANEREY